MGGASEGRAQGERERGGSRGEGSGTWRVFRLVLKGSVSCCAILRLKENRGAYFFPFFLLKGHKELLPQS